MPKQNHNSCFEYLIQEIIFGKLVVLNFVCTVTATLSNGTAQTYDLLIVFDF